MLTVMKSVPTRVVSLNMNVVLENNCIMWNFKRDTKLMFQVKLVLYNIVH